MASGLATRLITAVGPLLTIPWALSYLQTELFGLYMAAQSLAMSLQFADFGLGNGLLTKLPDAQAREDEERARRVLSSTYAILLAVSCLLLSLISVLAWRGVWANVFNIPHRIFGVNTNLAVALCLAAIAVNIPFSIITKVMYASHRVVAANVWQAGGALYSLPLVWWAIYADLGPTAVICLLVFSRPLANLINTIVFFQGHGRSLLPRLCSVNTAEAREVLGLGLKFVAVSASVSVGTGLDTFVLGMAAGLATAALFSIPGKVYNMVGQLITSLNLPLWPSNSAALALGEIDTVRATTRRMILISGVVAMLLGLFLVAFGDSAIRWWSGRALDIPTEYWIGMALWYVLLGSLSPMFMVQNACGVLLPQQVGWSVFAVSAFTTKLALSNAGRPELLPYASLGFGLLLLLPACLWGYRRALNSRPNHLGHQPNLDLKPVPPEPDGNCGWAEDHPAAHLRTVDHVLSPRTGKSR